MLVIMEFMVFFFFFSTRDSRVKEVNADMLRSCKKGDRKSVVLAKSFGRVGAVLC
jgi:preprotein translocase subunit YajC